MKNSVFLKKGLTLITKPTFKLAWFVLTNWFIGRKTCSLVVDNVELVFKKE